MCGPSNTRPTAAMGTPVPVSEADGRIAVMTTPGRSEEIIIAVVKRGVGPGWAEEYLCQAARTEIPEQPCFDLVR